MAVNAIQLWQKIENARLLSAETVRSLAAEVSEHLPTDQLLEAKPVAQWLLENGNLTKYQARVLLEQVQGPLRCGAYVVCDRLAESSLKHWYRAIANIKSPIDKSQMVEENFWLRAISGEELASKPLQSDPPSISLAARHAKISSESLCHLTPAQFSDGFLCIASSLPVGRPMVSTMAQTAMPASAVRNIIRQVAEGLSAIHEAGEVHGLVSMHTVCWDGDRTISLLRDPLFAPSNPLISEHQPSLIDIPYADRLRIAAPEFNAPGQRPTAASDLYALGCLWFELLAGRPYLEASEPARIMKSILAVKRPPMNIADFDLRYQKLLDHLLAKNPEARFASADDFLTALEYIVPKPASAKSEPPPPPAKAVPKPEIKAEQKAVAKIAPKVKAKTEQNPKPEKVVSKPTTKQPETSKVAALQPDRRQQAWKTTPNAADTVPPSPKIIEPRPDKKPTLDLSGLDGQTSTRRNSSRVHPKRSTRPAWFLPAVGTAAVVAIGVLAFALMGGSNLRTIAPDVRRNSVSDPVEQARMANMAAAKAEVAKPDPVAEQFTLVSNDREALWAPPHVPDPIALEFLPPGLQGLTNLNFESLTANAQIATIDSLLRPAYQMLADRIAADLPVDSKSWRALTIAMYPNDAGQWPDLVLRANLAKPQSADEIFKFYKFATKPEEISLGARKALQNADSSRGVVLILSPRDADAPESLSVQQIIVGNPQRIRDMVGMQGGSAPLTRQLEALRQASSGQNQFSILATTSLLLSSGRGLLAESLATLLPILQDEMQQDVAAISLASNLSSDVQGERSSAWYGELRLAGNAEQIAPQLQNQLRELLDKMPSQIESMMVQNSPDPYWAKLAIRLPQQLRTMQENLRTGIESGDAIANFYLPPVAAPNLITAAWLSLRQTPQTKSTTVAKTEAVKRLDIDTLLERPFTIAFEQESFEVTIRTMKEEFNSELNKQFGNNDSAIQIDINGPALEKDGITRNYQIRNFKHDGSPLRKVLVDVVRKANPITTVTNLTQPEQKLVWIVKDPATRQIEITTRTAVKAANIALPAEFEE